MHTVKARRVGNSTTITIPKDLEVEIGAEYTVKKEYDGVLTFTPKSFDEPYTYHSDRKVNILGIPFAVMEEMSEYKILEPNQDLEKRREYWELAKNLQEIDNLKTSQYLEEIIEGTLNGSYSTEEGERKLRKYYDSMDSESTERGSKEADIVAARITMELEMDAFSLHPMTLKGIHEKLFLDVFPAEWVGKFRRVNLSKSEPVLNGDSVQYAFWGQILDTLGYDIGLEKNYRYHSPMTDKEILNFSKFASSIWQVHPFREGNTRTVVTFLLKYLRFMKYPVDNAPFRTHSKWFRDALAISNYYNQDLQIEPDFSYLEMFFRNLLTDRKVDLSQVEIKLKLKSN